MPGGHRRPVVTRASIWLVTLGAVWSVFTGCGGSAETHGSPSEPSVPDAGRDRDVAVANDSGDADGSSCGSGAGAVMVMLAEPAGITGGCECDWYATGTDASAGSGSVDTGLSEFSVMCVPAGNYAMDCSCGPTAVTGSPDAASYCDGQASFSVTPGATTDVGVGVSCPE